MTPADPPSYDDALALLRGALLAAAANASAFALRSQAGHGLLSARGWAELAQIESLLAERLERVLLRELRAEPWPLPARIARWLRAQRDVWSGERSVIARQRAEAAAFPGATWRAASPPLDAGLVEFALRRTEHLANTLALAASEPAPFPALVWRPAQRDFRR